MDKSNEKRRGCVQKSMQHRTRFCRLERVERKICALVLNGLFFFYKITKRRFFRRHSSEQRQALPQKVYLVNNFSSQCSAIPKPFLRAATCARASARRWFSRRPSSVAVIITFLAVCSLDTNSNTLVR